jgi:hypothetical protein
VHFSESISRTGCFSPGMDSTSLIGYKIAILYLEIFVKFNYDSASQSGAR